MRMVGSGILSVGRAIRRIEGYTMTNVGDQVGKSIVHGPVLGTAAVGGSALATGNSPAVPNVFHFAQMTEMLVQFFGPLWFQHGQLAVRYLKPLKQGEELTAKANIVSQSDHYTQRLELEIWCENSGGELLASGTASCLWSS